MMELETLYVDGSIRQFNNDQARRISGLVRLLDMKVTLAEATNGKILQSDLFYIKQVHRFRLERGNLENSFAQMNNGMPGGPIKRVG